MFALYLVYRKHKSILHPFIITGTVWLLLVCVYELYATLYEQIPHLHSSTFNCVALYLVVFYIVSEFVIRKKTTPNLKKLLQAPRILNNRINLLFNIIFICNLYLIIRFFIITKSINIFTIISTSRTLFLSGYMPMDIKLFLYIFNLTFVLLSYYYLYRPKVSTSLIVAVIVEFCLVLLFIATKGKLFKYIIAVFILIYIKGLLTRKRLLYLAAISIGIVSILTYIRDAAFFSTGYYSVNDYIFIYTISPLPAFDALINGDIPFTNGSFGTRTLIFFYKILGLFFNIELDYGSGLGSFTQVVGPTTILPTNVYTALGGFYMDYGPAGIVVYAATMSLFFSLLYRNINRRKYFFVYILTVFCLALNFFGDFLFQFLSMTIQDIVAVLIVFSFRKVHTPIKLKL